MAYIPPQASAVSIGFAIPSATVEDVVSELMDSGEVEHAYFGIHPAEVTPELAAQLDVPTSDGVVVLEVEPDGPAADAGIEPGDVIVSLDGNPVRTPEEFIAYLRTKTVGEELDIVIVRSNGRLDAEVELTERPQGQ